MDPQVMRADAYFSRCCEGNEHRATSTRPRRRSVTRSGSLSVSDPAGNCCARGSLQSRLSLQRRLHS